MAAAEVPIATVSDALNGKGRLPDARPTPCARSRRPAGLSPSVAARTLRPGKLGLIGLTLTPYGDESFPFTEFAYFAEMARAATSAALARGYALVILPATSRHDVWSNVTLDGTVVIDLSDHDPVLAHDPCAGAVAADRLLARPDCPDAVYGLFDHSGTDLLAAARHYGMRVPDDLLLVCCSESTVYASTEPPVTTLSLKPRRIDTTVVQLLIDAIEGVDSDQPVEQVIPTELIMRTSAQRRAPNDVSDLVLENEQVALPRKPRRDPAPGDQGQLRPGRQRRPRLGPGLIRPTNRPS